MIAVFLHCVVRADARGNVNREQNKWHRALVRLESEGTLFPRKITPLRSHRGKVIAATVLRSNKYCVEAKIRSMGILIIQ